MHTHTRRRMAKGRTHSWIDIRFALKFKWLTRACHVHTLLKGGEPSDAPCLPLLHMYDIISTIIKPTHTHTHIFTLGCVCALTTSSSKVAKLRSRWQHFCSCGSFEMVIRRLHPRHPTSPRNSFFPLPTPSHFHLEIFNSFATLLHIFPAFLFSFPLFYLYSKLLKNTLKMHNKL